MSADETVEEIEEQSRERRGNGEGAVTERKGRATRSRRQSVDTAPKGNFLTRMWGGVRSYLGGVRDEYDKVVWPNREETVRLSRIILAVTIASAIVLGLVTLAFTELFVQGIRKERPIVFLIFGIAVVAVIWGYRRYNESEMNSSTYR